MSYSDELEERLGVNYFINGLEEQFDKSEYSGGAKNPQNTLRKLKLFLYREWDEWRPSSKGTIIDSTDCLSLVTIVHLLAARKGVETIIVRPKNITRYFHALLSYEDNGNDDIFKLSGRYRNYDCLPMGVDQVERRIRYTRPVVNLVNTLRFGNNITPPYQ